MMSLLRSYMLLEPRPQAEVRILCFHYAGGSARSFAPLARKMPPHGEFYLFEMPGRGLKATTPFLTSFAQLKACFLPDVLDVIDRPAILLGHSLGGLLAYSLACALPPEKLCLVRRVVVSGARSPKTVARSATYPPAPFIVRTRDSLLRDLVTFGGTPPEVFKDPELLEYTIQVLGHDLHLVDTYIEEECEGKEFPLETWFGRDDPAVPLSEAALWASVTPSPIQTRIFEGNHFYLFHNQEPAVALCDLIHAFAQQQVSEKSVT